MKAKNKTIDPYKMGNKGLAVPSTPYVPLMKKIKAYYQLTKPTIVLLVVVTTIPTLFLTGTLVTPALVLYTLFGTYLAASSASIFNHLVEGDVDKMMVRTKSRPVASGRVSKPVAGLLASLMGVGSFLLLYFQVNSLAAWIALIGNIFYVVIYTLYLKPRTPQNIVIGGAAGAVGPLIGWAAATGDLAWPAWVLFALIFFWTPPHFWALALKYKKDYEKAKIPMYPVVYGDHKTRRSMLLYSISLLPLALVLYFGDVAGLIYLVVATASTLYFIYLAAKLYLSKSNKSAMPLFYFSCLYLFIIFGALSLEKLLYLI